MILKVKYSGLYIINTETGELLPNDTLYDLQMTNLHHYIVDTRFACDDVYIGDIGFDSNDQLFIRNTNKYYQVHQDEKRVCINGMTYYRCEEKLLDRWKKLIAYELMGYHVVVYNLIGGRRLLLVLDKCGHLVLTRCSCKGAKAVGVELGDKIFYTKLVIAGLRWEAEHSPDEAKVVLD